MKKIYSFIEPRHPNLRMLAKSCTFLNRFNGSNTTCKQRSKR